MNFDDRTRAVPHHPDIDKRGEPPSQFSVLCEACLYFIYRDRMHISKHLLGKYEYSGITYQLANIIWDTRGDRILDPAILEVVASGRSWRELPTPKVRAEVTKMWKAAQSLPRPDFSFIHMVPPQVELEFDTHSGIEDHQHVNIEAHQRHAELEDHQHPVEGNHHHTENHQHPVVGDHRHTEDHQHVKKKGKKHA